jgi:hypothetical protein
MFRFDGKVWLVMKTGVELVFPENTIPVVHLESGEALALHSKRVVEPWINPY